ncbi:MAG: TonB-dependent receptor [Lewinellaceae bacterium]|nr:TonB-dependent receptor [Lewinellaceae bacterium]
MSALLHLRSWFKPRVYVLSGLAVLLSLSTALAQNTVTGTVNDDDGNPLTGVTVVEKGTSNGTSTDITGSFRLTVSRDATLRFSYVGFQTIEVPVNGQSSVQVKLSTDLARLDEVVVIGYGSVKREDLTGSVSSVNSENFNVGPQLAPQQLIQGKIAGVNISKNSGKPGGANSVRIRGGTSITASNDPLYVIDGVPISTSAGVSSANIRSGSQNDFFDQEPTNPLQTLNPNDIESVIVLKDASATAIYGSRGANGVIMITTKKGRIGQAQVSYDVSAGYSKASNKIDMLNASEYRSIHQQLGLTVDDRGFDTDWQDEVYRTAFQHNHYLSVTGGSDQTRVRASVGYGNQEGVLLSSNIEQANARININHAAMNDRVNFDLRLNYGQNKSNQTPISNTVGSEFGSSLNYESYVFNPTYPVYNADGSYTQILPFRTNPVSYSTQILDELTNRRLIGDFSASYRIFNPLTFKVNVGYTNQTIDRNSFVSKDNPQGTGAGGFASVQQLNDYSKLLETTLSFKKDYGAHGFDAVVGYSYQYFLEEGLRNTANGFLSDEFKWYSLQAAKTISLVSTFVGSNTLISTYGRLNYNFGNRYFITGTIRRDGSSRFGSGNKWGTFPSAAVAWKISEEEFFNGRIFSDLKLRASYGITGNQEIGNLNSITTLGASSNGYIVGGQRITIVLPEQYANPDLRWEETAQLDIGLNFGLFNNKLYGSLDYYRKKTSDLLLRIAVPSPSVVSTQIANVGSVENKGIELELGAELMRKPNFSWNLNLNFSRNKNEVLSLSNDLFASDDIPSAPTQGQGLSGTFSQIIKPGLAIGTFYGKVFTGFDDNGLETYAAEPAVLGSAQPDFTYGLSNYLTYKNWSLALNIRGSVGNDVYNGTQNNLGYLANLPGRNVSTLAVSSGVSRDQPKVFSSRWIEDGSFLRLDNATLGYRFNMSNTAFSSARLYLTGQNLLLLTGYSGLDPEVNSDVSGTGVAPLGVDYLAYPRAKSLILGANLTF